MHARYKLLVMRCLHSGLFSYHLAASCYSSVVPSLISLVLLSTPKACISGSPYVAARAARRGAGSSSRWTCSCPRSMAAWAGRPSTSVCRLPVQLCSPWRPTARCVPGVLGMSDLRTNQACSSHGPLCSHSNSQRAGAACWLRPRELPHTIMFHTQRAQGANRGCTPRQTPRAASQVKPRKLPRPITLHTQRVHGAH